MKCSLCCIAAYYLTAVLTIIQQIEAIPDQFPIWKPGGDTSSSIVPEVVLKAPFLIIHVKFKNQCFSL